ncbi:hypothetical protein [Salmonella enterica]|uniref:hypothetical protein n=1 Tax=Salmonella enterica TaxID=28901 RepID=UPI00398C53C3
MFDLVVVWFGIGHAVINALGRVIKDMREIASEHLTTTLTVPARKEVAEEAGTGENMKTRLTDRVRHVGDRWCGS